MTQPEQEAREMLARCTLRLNSPSVPGQRHTAILTEDLRMLLAFAARPIAGIDREAFAAAWGDHPQWADVRSNILSGACDVLSDPISLACSIALKAMARLKESTPAKTGERGAVIEECDAPARVR